MPDRAVIGLGNPGRDYLETRHNVGFLLIDRLIDAFGASEVRGHPSYVSWASQRDEDRVLFVKPTTYMNASGHAVAALRQAFSLAPDHLLIAYDDVALPVGVIRLRPKGSAGGQKGMRHIIEILDRQDIPRLRIGIDSEFRDGRPLPDFVLGKFREAEAPLISDALKQAEAATRYWLDHGMLNAMAKFNTRPSPEPLTVESNHRGGER